MSTEGLHRHLAYFHRIDQDKSLADYAKIFHKKHNGPITSWTELHMTAHGVYNHIEGWGKEHTHKGITGDIRWFKY